MREAQTQTQTQAQAKSQAQAQSQVPGASTGGASPGLLQCDLSVGLLGAWQPGLGPVHKAEVQPAAVQVGD